LAILAPTGVEIKASQTVTLEQRGFLQCRKKKLAGAQLLGTTAGQRQANRYNRVVRRAKKQKKKRSAKRKEGRRNSSVRVLIQTIQTLESPKLNGWGSAGGSIYANIEKGPDTNTVGRGPEAARMHGRSRSSKAHINRYSQNGHRKKGGRRKPLASGRPMQRLPNPAPARQKPPGPVAAKTTKTGPVLARGRNGPINNKYKKNKIKRSCGWS